MCWWTNCDRWRARGRDHLRQMEALREGPSRRGGEEPHAWLECWDNSWKWGAGGGMLEAGRKGAGGEEGSGK